MFFCACGEMSDGNWKKCSEEYHTTDQMIKWVNEQFPNKAGLDDKGYQPNSREDVRRHTMKPWIDAAIIEMRPGLATNDKNNGYRFTAKFAALVRKYRTEEWSDALSEWLEVHGKYSDVLKQIKAIDVGVPVTFRGETFKLSGGKHNKLQKAILEDFARFHTKDAELLYIGDTSERYLKKDESRMEELGIDIMRKSKELPDVILYDRAYDRVIFIEAYSSTGEFTFARVKQTLSMCHFPKGRTVAFVTAFQHEELMGKVLLSIAWDTDIWVADDATHMIHKNGDKFIGRDPKDFDRYKVQ